MSGQSAVDEGALLARYSAIQKAEGRSGRNGPSAVHRRRWHGGPSRRGWTQRERGAVGTRRPYSGQLGVLDPQCGYGKSRWVTIEQSTGYRRKFLTNDKWSRLRTNCRPIISKGPD